MTGYEVFVVLAVFVVAFVALSVAADTVDGTMRRLAMWLLSGKPGRWQ